MKLLMHMCCAPCSVFPASTLLEEGAIVEGLFYNPNIHPYEEYQKRGENVRKFSEITGIPVEFVDDFRQADWEAWKAGTEERCTMCYATRLDRAAAFAAEKGYDAYTTSLLVSPYQKHELIRELGEKFGKKHGIPFSYRDFRPGFRQGQQRAREMGLYRQKFCGCIISYNESPFTKKTE